MRPWNGLCLHTQDYIILLPTLRVKNVFFFVQLDMLFMRSPFLLWEHFMIFTVPIHTNCFSQKDIQHGRLLSGVPEIVDSDFPHKP